MAKNKATKDIAALVVDLREISIVLDDRTRKRLNGIEELASAIKEVGLLNPPSIVRLKNPTASGEKYLLAAGARRLTALRLLAEKSDGSWEIPVRILPNNDAYTVALVEGIENNQRSDFTPLEQIQHNAKMHRLLTEKYGAAIPGTGIGQSLSKTAELLRTSVAQLSKDIKLVSQMEILPEEVKESLLRSPTRADLEKTVNTLLDRAETTCVAATLETSGKAAALNIASPKALKQAEKAAATAAATETSRANSINKPAGSVARENRVPQISEAYRIYPKTETLEESGVFKFLYKDVEALSCDFIEIDPPYGINLKEVKKSETGGTAAMDYVDVDESVYPAFMEKVAQGAARVMKPNTWGIVWFAERWQSTICDIFEKIGFAVSKTPAIWYKNVPGQTNNPKYILGSAYEAFFYFRKGTVELASMGHSNVFVHTPVSSGKIHPAERPASLIRELLTTFLGASAVKRRIVVPFCGSGRTLIESMRMGHDCIGCDIIPEYRSRYIVAATTELA